ncbi:MAG: hypothetical protein WBD47_13640 [Phormidesmis sp.]
MTIADKKLIRVKAKSKSTGEVITESIASALLAGLLLIGGFTWRRAHLNEIAREQHQTQVLEQILQELETAN